MTMMLLVCAVVGIVLGRTIRHLVPVLLHLKDRNLPFSWPWVELVGGILFALTAWTKGIHWQSVPPFLFALFLLTIVACDYGWKLIPDRVIHVGIGVGLISAALVPADLVAYVSHVDLLTWIFSTPLPQWVYGVFLSVTGGVVGFLVLEILRRVFLHMTGMEVMGAGDVRITALIGAFLGPGMVLLCLLPASIFGIVNGLVFRLAFRTPHSPFGPALAFGGLAMLHFHREMLGGLDAFYAFFYSLPLGVVMSLFLLCIIALIFLVWRIKQRAASYAEEIERDYADIEEELESPLE